MLIFKRKAYLGAIFIFLNSILLAYGNMTLTESGLWVVVIMLMLWLAKLVDLKTVAAVSVLLVISAIGAFMFSTMEERYERYIGKNGKTIEIRGYFYKDNPFDEKKVLLKVNRVISPEGLGFVEGSTVIVDMKVSQVADIPPNGKESRVKLDVRTIRAPGNPGFFDYKKYLALKNSFLQSSTMEIESTTPLAGTTLTHGLISAREALVRNISDRLKYFNNSSTYGPAVGMLMGFDDFIDQDKLDDYFLSGTVHILTVSGFHFALMYSIFTFLLAGFETWYKVKLYLSVIFVVFMLLICGFKFAPIRAGICMLIMLAAPLFKREFDFLSASSVIILVELVINPYKVYDMSLALTFLSCIGIGTFSSILSLKGKGEGEGFFASKFKNGANGVIMTLGVEFALFVPIVMSTNTINWVSFISSVVGAALSGIFIPIEMFALFMGIKSQVLSNLFIFVLDILNSSIEWMNKLYSVVPNSIFYMADYRMSISLFFFVVMLVFVMIQNTDFMEFRNKRFLFGVSVSILLITGMVVCNNLEDTGKLEITVFDVGQGDSILIKAPNGESAMIDYGTKFFKLEEAILNNKIIKPTYFLRTHNHADHTGGSKNLGKIIKMENEMYLMQNETLKIGDATIKCIYKPEVVDLRDENNNCRVYMVSYKGFDMLVTGDIGFDAENKIVRRELVENQIEVLKVAHHGSKYSTSSVFLEALRPVVSVISVGKNTYGHPSGYVMDDLGKVSQKIFRTDRDGAVIISTDGVAFEVKSIR